mgnify:CR=1 FL=1
MSDISHAYLKINGIEEIVVSTKHLDTSKLIYLIDSSVDTKVKITKVPPIEKWINGELNTSQIKTVQIEDDKLVKAQIWDTAGQERFKTITSSYYKGAHGIIVTYDITDRESFSKVSEWMSEVDKHAQENISRILVGNKKDLEDQRQVPY